jgi:hypothetical protein
MVLAFDPILRNDFCEVKEIYLKKVTKSLLAS